MRKLWLPVILILAFLLRFIGLTNYPVGFNADEASFGYDAYSILKTSRDQWGNFLPLTFKSFGDYKAPLYGYLTIPFIAIFGLTPFAVRLPNAIIGTLAVYVLYLLTLKIKNLLKFGNWPLEIMAALLFAISPWSVMMSRGAFEANLITLFIPLGIYLFLKEKINWSAVVFGLSLFTYHSAKIISPIVFFGLLILFKKKKLISIFAYLPFLIASIWIIANGAGARISERSITRGALEEGAVAKIALIQNGANPTLAKLRHNKYQVVVARFINNYLQYISPKFLFYQGAGEYYYGMIHGVAVMYVFEGLLCLGVIKFIFDKKHRKVLLLLVSWILVAIVPSALSTGVGYSGHRAIGMIPAIQIVSSLGALGWYQYVKKFSKNTKNILALTIGVLVSMNVYKFTNIYFKNIPNDSYNQMLYQNNEFSEWLVNTYPDQKILISRSISEPQIFIAFANKIDPNFYQSETKKWDVETWVDQIPEYSLGNITIKSIDWKKDIKNNGIVIAGRPSEFPKGIIPDKSFDLPDGSPIIYVKTF